MAKEEPNNTMVGQGAFYTFLFDTVGNKGLTVQLIAASPGRDISACTQEMKHK